MQKGTSAERVFSFLYRTLDVSEMQPFKTPSFFSLMLLTMSTVMHAGTSYTAESSLGQCFRDISEGYILLFDRSFVDCVRECKRRRRCQTIRYDRGTLICMLYPKSSIPQTSYSGCFQSSREEFKNRYVRLCLILHVQLC